MATPTFGTNTLLDQLAAQNQTVAGFGVDNAFDYIDKAFDAHNMLMKDMRSALMSDTTERQVRGASNALMTVQELDEFGTPPAQKLTAGVPLGFPLKRYGAAVQWTGLALKRMTTREIAIQAKGVMDGDIVAFQVAMQAAFYRPTNYNYNDRFVDYLQSFPLAVKALQNADSFPIPPGPNGESFNESTHTHYMVAASTSTFAPADMDALILNVREHFGNGKGYVGINQAEAATVSAMAKFRAVVDTRIIQANTATYVNTGFAGLDTVNTNNRLIGIYDGVEVWVKPWVIAAYPIAWWEAPGVIKPLAYRHDPVLPSEMSRTYQGEVHGLLADVWERYFGIGVWNRIAMAVLDVNHASYTAPI